MRKILIVYYYHQYPVRTTIWDHLYSFRRYSGDHCFYLNLGFRGKLPDYIKHVPFDMIIFHTIFLHTRWSLSVFEKALKKAAPLKQHSAVKIALPQDEFIHTDALCDFINDFGIDCVFSVAPESEWPKIYHKVNFEKVKFFKVLTGYLDPETVTRINVITQSNQNRSIDIGYRAYRAAPWLGRHGVLKTQIADLFDKMALKAELVTDISTQEEDTFLGDDWYRFLARCNFTIGVEGGASILDKDGTVKEKVEEYLIRNPQADFEEVEVACFPDMDDKLKLFAISPRHLEACATKTCQILVEGEYSGVLAPGKHYIELKSDFSNIDQVLKLVKQDHLRETLAAKAYRDVIASERYTYPSFVAFILQNALSDRAAESSPSPESGRVKLIYYWLRLADLIYWGVAALRTATRRLLVAMFSEQNVLTLVHRVKQLARSS